MANCGDWSDDALAERYLSGIDGIHYALIELIDTLSTVLAGTAGTACAIVRR
jgi:hypothetical protein